MHKHPICFTRVRLSRSALAATLMLLTMLIASPRSAHAQDKPSPDTLVFTNGDSLKGKLVSATGADVTFHSDMAGDLTISWDKVKTIDSADKFAVIKKGVKLSKKTPENDVSQGTIAVSDKAIHVATPSGPASVSTNDTQAVIADDEFQKTLYHDPGFIHGFNGAFTLGAALVDSTQTSRTFNAALSLARIEPNATWVSPRNKTLFNSSLIYGIQKQQANAALNIPFSSVKTDIIHGDLERDEYLTSRFYYLGYASADHNYSQGLALQDIFGGGVGYTVLKNAKQELDAKTDLHYEQQQFIPASGSPDNNLIGMDFAETYMRKLPKGLALTETGVVTPAFNDASTNATQTNAGKPFSADFSTVFTFPVYKRLSFNAGVIDNYISNPAAGFKDNSFQFTFGATYAFK